MQQIAYRDDDYKFVEPTKEEAMNIEIQKILAAGIDLFDIFGLFD